MKLIFIIITIYTLMLRNISNKLLNISRPKYLAVGNFRISLDYSNPLMKNQLTFFDSDVKETMDINSVYDVATKYNRNINLSFYKNNLGSHNIFLLNAACKFQEHKSLLLNDIYSYTFFSSNLEQLNITKLVKLYNLNSFDVFYNLVSKAKTFNMGILSYNHNEMSKEKIKEQFLSQIKEQPLNNYIYFDYWNEIGLKSKFLLDTTNDLIPFEINMQRYNDYSGYLRLLCLLVNNIANRNENFDKYEPLEPIFIDEPINISEDRIEQINNLIDKSFESYKNDKIFQTVVLEKNPNYYNHRFISNFDSDNKIWPYQTTEFYNQYIKPYPAYCELVSRFDFDFEFRKNLITPNHKNGYKHISLVNMIVFGKTKINFDTFERLLPLVRYKIYDNHIQLDNWIINRLEFPANDGPKYNVEWSDTNIHELDFVQTDREKLVVAKNLILLMNEVDPKFLNFHNYWVVAEWYQQNDFAIQTIFD